MTLYIPMVELTDGGSSPIDTSKLAELEAFVSLHGEVTHLSPIVTDSALAVQLSADLKEGQYLLAYSFKYDGMPCAGRWSGVLDIVKDNAQSNWQGFVNNRATLDDQIYIAGSIMSDEEFERLKAEYRAMIAEAEEAKASADAAKAEADAVAYNAAHTLTKDGIKEAVEEAIEGGISVEVDLTPVTERLDNPTYGLAALLEAISSHSGGGASIEEIREALAVLQSAMQGEDQTATISAVLGVVTAVQSSALTAQDKQDILTAIEAATPTIDFTVVLNAISASETSIKNAMPSVDGLALETSVQTIIGMLTLQDGEVTAELETLIPNK